MTLDDPSVVDGSDWVVDEDERDGSDERDTRRDRTGKPGSPVTPANARAFGRSVAKSLREFLSDPKAGPILPPASPAGTVLFEKKEIALAGAAWPVPAELAGLENGFAVEFTLEAGPQKPWAGVVQARFADGRGGWRLPFSFSSDDRNRLYFRMDTHLSVNEQNAVTSVPVFDGKPHRIRATFEPNPDCANDTRVVGYVDEQEAFRVDRRRGRVGFSSVAENLLTVNCGRAPFAGRVRDLRVTKTR